MYSKPGPRIKKIIDLAKKAKIPVEEVAESDLDKISVIKEQIANGTYNIDIQKTSFNDN